MAGANEVVGEQRTEGGGLGELKCVSNNNQSINQSIKFCSFIKSTSAAVHSWKPGIPHNYHRSHIWTCRPDTCVCSLYRPNMQL